MSVAGVLASDLGLTLLGSVLGGIWTLFKASGWYRGVRRRRLRRAIRVIEAAVEQTYRSYVQAIKEARSDGKLTAEERARARAIARERALEIARKEGVDLLQELGEDFISLWIAKLVRQLKGK